MALSSKAGNIICFLPDRSVEVIPPNEILEMAILDPLTFNSCSREFGELSHGRVCVQEPLRDVSSGSEVMLRSDLGALIGC